MARNIGMIAQYQLAKWQHYAMTEPTQIDIRDDEIHRICIRCKQSIVRESDGINPYIMSLDTMLSLIVAHLRQNHSEIEVEVYGDD